MEPWTYVVEIAAYLVACVSLYKAGTKYGRDVFAVAFSAMVYSYAVEASFVLLPTGYSYSDKFLVMLPGAVPLWVPVGWGTIVFVATKTANRVGLTWWTRPLAAAVLALLLDFALDPIAVQLRFWTFPDGGTFYGVSWGNFNGWLLIVASYSIVVEFVYQKVLNKPRPKEAIPHREWWIPVAAIIPAYVVCVVAHLVFQVLPAWIFKAHGAGERGWIFVLLFLAFIGLVAYVAHRTRVVRHNPVVWGLLVVPLAYLSLFSAFSFMALHETHPELRVWIPLFGCLVVLAFLWPSIEVVSVSKRTDPVGRARRGQHEILRRLERDEHRKNLDALTSLQRFFADIDTVPSMERALPNAGTESTK